MARSAIIYTRVSTDDQKENGFSLREQEARLRSYCKRENFEIVKHYQDDYSAKDFNRPEFQKMLSDLREKRVKADLFICVRNDRFSRNALETLNMLQEFKKLGIEYRTLDTNYDLSIPENLIPFFVNIVLPQVDNERRSINTKRGMRQANREGRWTHKPPKGYKLEKENGKSYLVPDDNAFYIKFAFEQYAKGIFSVEEIRQSLRNKGCYICKTQMHKILRNYVYIGKIKIPAWKDEEEEIVEGLHEPIIAEETFHIVQSILNGRKPKHKKKSRYNEFLPLRGHLVCPICSGNLTGSASRSKTGAKHYYYHCNRGCKLRLRADKTNQAFSNYLKTFNIPDEILSLYYHILKDVFDRDETDKEKEIGKLESIIMSNRDLIERVEDKFFKNEIDKGTYSSAKKRYNDTIVTLENKILELRMMDSNFMKYAEYGLSLLHDLEGYYNNSPIEVKSLLISSIFPSKIIFDGKNYRTPKVNEVLSLLTSNINNLGEYKKQKVVKNDNLFALASPGGVEPPLQD